MGLLQGRVRGGVFHISDCFRLPVEGTETRVNAGEDAMEYLVEFIELNEQTECSSDAVCGWYHSHPGYGCWLSGIDVGTQALYQQHQDPFVAIVIDPHKTSTQGEIEIGAFRTYPPGYVGETEPAHPLDPEEIPLSKSGEFGAHTDKYYQLEIDFEKSDLTSRIVSESWKRNWTQNILRNPRPKPFPSVSRDPSKAKEYVKQCACAHVRGIADKIISSSVLAGVVVD